MSRISIKYSALIFSITLFSHFILGATSTNREALEVIVGVGVGVGVGIGGGSGGCNNENCSPSQNPPPPLPPLTPPAQQAAPPVRPPKNMVFADQRLAAVYLPIQKLKSTITSDPLGITKSWQGSNICNYKGFYCDNPPDNKTAIALASVDFNGFHLTSPTLDGFLDQLPDIALFHANSNNFSGTISPNISKLPYLYELDISNNQFSGEFPISIIGMNSLSFLDIRFNFFTGSIPSELFMKDDLQVLFLNNNNFMEKIPDNLGTSRLFYLTLANNKFSGSIPRTISKTASNLTELIFLNNMLDGCLPYEIGFLKEAVVFDVGNNLLTGPIPFSLGCLENVEVLNFAGNLFCGMVPEVVCGLGNLVNLSISDNYFQQVGPICRRLIKSGVVDVRKNCIPGLPFQRSVLECVAFFAQPRYCPFMETYTYIPCAIPHFSTPTLGFSDKAPSPS